MSKNVKNKLSTKLLQHPSSKRTVFELSIYNNPSKIVHYFNINIETFFKKINCLNS